MARRFGVEVVQTFFQAKSVHYGRMYVFVTPHRNTRVQKFCMDSRSLMDAVLHLKKYVEHTER